MLQDSIWKGRVLGQGFWLPGRIQMREDPLRTSSGWKAILPHRQVAFFSRGSTKLPHSFDVAEP